MDAQKISKSNEEKRFVPPTGPLTKISAVICRPPPTREPRFITPGSCAHEDEEEGRSSESARVLQLQLSLLIPAPQTMNVAGYRRAGKTVKCRVTELTGFHAPRALPLAPGRTSLAATDPAIPHRYSCQNLAKFSIHPSGSKANPQVKPNTSGRGKRKTARPRGRPVILKEVLGAQRLRKQGKWREAKQLLDAVKTQAQNDPNYLNEVLHVRAAQLRHTNPSLPAADLYDELYNLSESMPARSNATTFNAILSGLRDIRASQKPDMQSEPGIDLEVASKVFDTMLDKRLFPDHYTMSILFQMCASNRSFQHTKRFEQKAKELFDFQANVISGSSLLSAYAKCGKLESFEEVLEDLQARQVPLNERTYASVISAYHRNSRHSKVMECYQAAMNSDSVQPNIFIFSGTLASCSRARDAASARIVFDSMVRTNTAPTEDILVTLFETAVRSGDTSLGIDILFEWGPQYGLLKPTLARISRLISASKKSVIAASKAVNGVKTIMKRLVDETDLKPDVAILNSLISAFAGLGSFEDAWKVLDEGFSRFGLSPNVATYNILIHSLGRAKRPEHAVRAWELMHKNGLQPNQLTYNSLLDVLIEGQKLDDATRLIEEMKTEPGVGIDSAVVLLQLKIFRISKDPEAAMNVYRSCIKEGKQLDPKTHGLLLTALFEAGRSDQAISVFGWLLWKRLATAIVFNVVLDYVGRVQKNNVRCLTLFASMKEKGVVPDEITYSTLIRVCSRNGLIDKAFRLLGEMQDVGLGMTDTYAWTALIDGCGRAGQWQRAVDVLKSMRDAKGTLKLIPAPTTSCYNAAIYAGSMRGGGWKVAVEIYEMLLADENQEPDSVTYSAMASTILSHRFDIREWGIVKEVYEKLKEATDKDGEEKEIERVQQRMSGSTRKVEKGVRKKLLAKVKRVGWVLRQAEEGKLMKKRRAESSDVSDAASATTEKQSGARSSPGSSEQN